MKKNVIIIKKNWKKVSFLNPFFSIKRRNIIYLYYWRDILYYDNFSLKYFLYYIFI